MDRPALERMRADLKTDLFDAVYFHSADRIARAAAHQTIIVDELLKHGKKITIAGKDYEENPENKFALTVMGAANEFERAKIIERTTRGRLHRLRMGQLSSTGHRIYGYQGRHRPRQRRSSSTRSRRQSSAHLRDVREWQLRTCHHLALP